MLFTESALSAIELFSLKVKRSDQKIIEFGQKGCVAMGVTVRAIL